MEHIESKCRADSPLYFSYICSIRNRSRTRDMREIELTAWHRATCFWNSRKCSPWRKRWQLAQGFRHCYSPGLGERLLWSCFTQKLARISENTKYESCRADSTLQLSYSCPVGNQARTRVTSVRIEHVPGWAEALRIGWRSWRARVRANIFLKWLRIMVEVYFIWQSISQGKKKKE